MKKNIFIIAFFIAICGYSQVGIGTNNPSATLHIKEKRDDISLINATNSKDGILIPRLSKQELASKTTGTYDSTTNGSLVFVKEISSNTSGPSNSQTTSILAIGFHYFNGNKWLPIIGEGLDTTDDAWVNNPSASRVELGTNSKGATRAANTKVVLTDAGYMGINTETPTKRLEINAATPGNTTDYLRITNLAIPSATTITSTLQIDSQGNVGKKSEENVEGQIIRFPIKSADATIITQGNPYGILIDKNNSTAPNGASNSINMITGSSINEYTYPNNNIKTDRIILPAGIYKIEAKILGNFSTASTTNSLNLKALINGIEFTSQDFGAHTSTSGQRYTGFIATDFIKLDQSAEIDFILETKQHPFNLIGPVAIGSALSFRSLLLIQRLK